MGDRIDGCSTGVNGGDHAHRLDRIEIEHRERHPIGPLRGMYEAAPFNIGEDVVEAPHRPRP